MEIKEDNTSLKIWLNTSTNSITSFTYITNQTDFIFARRQQKLLLRMNRCLYVILSKMFGHRYTMSFLCELVFVTVKHT